MLTLGFDRAKLTILSSARGNTSLESAVSLTKSLRWDIQTLGQRLAVAANDDDLTRRGGSNAKSKSQNELELKRIIQDIRKLLGQIEDAVPLINLAITTSGASLSTSLPSTISPSRLLQASTFLTAGDAQFSMSLSKPVQIGPTFTLSFYMLFSGHLRPEHEEDLRASTWKEVIHKARVKLVRVPLDAVYGLPTENRRGGAGEHSSRAGDDLPNLEAESKADEFAYQLIIIEDLEDDRVHTFEDNEAQPERYDDVEIAGIREAVPIHEISKIFYADTGKILNIGGDGETNSPILLLKRDINAIPPRRMMDQFSSESAEDAEYQNPMTDNDESQSEIDAQIGREQLSSSVLSSVPLEAEGTSSPEKWRIPSDLDPEWLAFEVYTEAEDSDTESEADQVSSASHRRSRTPSLDPQMTDSLSHLQLNASETPNSNPSPSSRIIPQSSSFASSLIQRPHTLPPIRTSLSLLETIIRLLSLQQFQQTSHLSIPDELLNFFLSESATTGAAHGDDQERRRLRNEARRRVGFDPYDESPVKRRGEDYQYRGSNSQAGWLADDNQDAQPQWNESFHSHVSPRNEQFHGSYASPGRSDEGYDTHTTSHQPRSSPSFPHGSNPQTPPMLLKHRAASRTPDLPTPSSSSPAAGPKTSDSPSRRAARQERFNALKRSEVARRGSPLARPGVGMVDEGLGTSPGEMPEEGQKASGLTGR